ncbi:MAG: hypothetical protein JXM79_08705 [Sedimentisphaerales bacterium]|nr:hypothetical protein [Sedimentisphaerales bacterium]
MRGTCALIWSLCLTAAPLGQQTKIYTCNGKVVDFNARPVIEAEVICYEGFSEYEKGRLRYEMLGRARTNEADRLTEHPLPFHKKQMMADTPVTIKGL